LCLSGDQLVGISRQPLSEIDWGSDGVNHCDVEQGAGDREAIIDINASASTSKMTRARRRRSRSCFVAAIAGSWTYQSSTAGLASRPKRPSALQWRDVDLAGSRLTVRVSKTDAGMRQVDLLPALRDELAAYKAQAASAAPSGFVFTTAAGSELIQGNIRRRVLDKAVAKANGKLIEAGEIPLPEGLTPHKLRHTFASILVALGVDPGSVMDQIGHTDPGFTQRVYRHGMRRDGAAQEHLRALVAGVNSDALGSEALHRAVAEFAPITAAV
jgi:integrase